MQAEACRNGKCYRPVVELADKNEWEFGPVTGFRCAAGDRKKGQNWDEVIQETGELPKGNV